MSTRCFGRLVLMSQNAMLQSKPPLMTCGLRVSAVQTVRSGPKALSTSHALMFVSAFRSRLPTSRAPPRAQ